VPVTSPPDATPWRSGNGEWAFRRSAFCASPALDPLLVQRKAGSVVRFLGSLPGGRFSSTPSSSIVNHRHRLTSPLRLHHAVLLILGLADDFHPPVFFPRSLAPEPEFGVTSRSLAPRAEVRRHEPKFGATSRSLASRAERWRHEPEFGATSRSLAPRAEVWRHEPEFGATSRSLASRAEVWAASSPPWGG
jgi:hypothetical protein